MQNVAQYAEARQVLKASLQAMEMPKTYYLLAHVYNIENNWTEAIASGEKAMAIDPTFMATYPALLTAYIGGGKWEEASKIADNVRAADPNGYCNPQLDLVESSLAEQRLSGWMWILVWLAVAGFFLFPIIKGKTGEQNPGCGGS